jgi:hypothetical protein
LFSRRGIQILQQVRVDIHEYDIEHYFGGGVVEDVVASREEEYSRGNEEQQRDVYENTAAPHAVRSAAEDTDVEVYYIDHC